MAGWGSFYRGGGLEEQEDEDQQQQEEEEGAEADGKGPPTPSRRAARGLLPALEAPRAEARLLQLFSHVP